jgi:glucose/arabinose dehydrogenase
VNGSGGSRAAALLMPAATEVASVDFVPLRPASPLAGELLVASSGAADVLRVRTDGERPGLVAGLLEGRYGSIAAVRVAADGTILVATGNRDTWGAGRDVLVRLVAAGR